MRVYKDKTVFEESLDRIRFLFDEFEDVYISMSGGKDSTVVYELARIVAREKGRLPLKVMFLDQEAEYQSTIDLMQKIMYDDEVEPIWLQIPIKLFNATSRDNDWLYCWEEGKEWMREKDPISIKENRWGTDRFHEFFYHFMDKESHGKKICYLSGVRGEESPSRLMGLTQDPTYKWITWGKKNKFNKNVFTFHPIYDWSYLDVWKAIHDNDWEYNAIYDAQYSYGVALPDMRVSNLHHETAIHHLFILQEVEPDTYQRLTTRIQGVDTAGKLGKQDYYVYELPFMFKDWKEYRDYLLENLITDEEKKKKFSKMFKSIDEKYSICVKPENIYKTQIQSILANDYHGTKLDNAIRGKWQLALKDYKRELAKREMARRKAESE